LAIAATLCYAAEVEYTCKVSGSMSAKTCELKGVILKNDDTLKLSLEGEASEFRKVKFSNSELEKIPNEIFETFKNLVELQVAEAKLKKLEPDYFKNANNLKELDLRGNEIKELTDGVFREAPNLENIDLSENGMTTVDKDAFKYISKIKELNFEKNEIKELHKDTFQSLDKLERVTLKTNKIEVVENELFTRNPALKDANFDGNKIIAIGPKVFNTTGKPEDFTISLSGAHCTDARKIKNPVNIEDIFKCITRYSIDNVENNFSDLESKISAVSNDLSETTSKLAEKLQTNKKDWKKEIDESNKRSRDLETKVSQLEALLADLQNSSLSSVKSIESQFNETYQQASAGFVALAGLCVLMFFVMISICTKKGKTPVQNIEEPEDVIISSKTLEAEGKLEVKIPIPECQTMAEYRPRHHKKHKKNKKRRARKETTSESESESEAESSEKSE
jgi:Leucine-rich repeat (LRR) protein